jgi:hypothetical protein
MPQTSARLVSSVFVYALLGASAAVACSDDSPAPVSSDPPVNGGIFGGNGGGAGIVQPGLAGSSSSQAGQAGQAGQANPPAPACGTVARGKLALLDDFEGSDTAVEPEPTREGFWFTIHDDSEGTVEPNGDLAPVLGGADGSQRAVHASASGYSVWGAAVASTLSHIENGVRCPYNASAFAGLRFFLRGSGRVRLSVQVPATVDVEFGGTCDPAQGMTCYDQHGVYLTLNEDWQLHEVPWSELVQRAFGTPAPFTPEAVMGVQLALEAQDLPVDVWWDEITFWDGAPASGGAGGASAGGAGGASAGGAAAGGAGGDGGSGE